MASLRLPPMPPPVVEPEDVLPVPLVVPLPVPPEVKPPDEESLPVEPPVVPPLVDVLPLSEDEWWLPPWLDPPQLPPW
ncbi:hypothetical protein GCM10010315_30760 [Streptomyces luteosporeus]|uniref:Uncharacterized protein n=1 Tax=Streptomyces luteosporeus TaxID=173856 RepID=A0ABN3TSK6_9ACTN